MLKYPFKLSGKVIENIGKFGQDIGHEMRYGKDYAGTPTDERIALNSSRLVSAELFISNQIQRLGSVLVDFAKKSN